MDDRRIAARLTALVVVLAAARAQAAPFLVVEYVGESYDPSAPSLTPKVEVIKGPDGEQIIRLKQCMDCPRFHRLARVTLDGHETPIDGDVAFDASDARALGPVGAFRYVRTKLAGRTHELVTVTSSASRVEPGGVDTIADGLMKSDKSATTPDGRLWAWAEDGADEKHAIVTLSDALTGKRLDCLSGEVPMTPQEYLASDGSAFAACSSPRGHLVVRTRGATSPDLQRDLDLPCRAMSGDLRWAVVGSHGGILSAVEVASKRRIVLGLGAEAAFTPDGKTVLFVREVGVGKHRQGVLRAVSLADGTQRMIARVPSGYHDIDVVPDGSAALLFDDKAPTALLVPLAGDKPKAVPLHGEARHVIYVP